MIEVLKERFDKKGRLYTTYLYSDLEQCRQNGSPNGYILELKDYFFKHFKEFSGYLYMSPDCLADFIEELDGEEVVVEHEVYTWSGITKSGFTLEAVPIDIIDGYFYLTRCRYRPFIVLPLFKSVVEKHVKQGE